MPNSTTPIIVVQPRARQRRQKGLRRKKATSNNAKTFDQTTTTAAADITSDKNRESLGDLTERTADLSEWSKSPYTPKALERKVSIVRELEYSPNVENSATSKSYSPPAHSSERKHTEMTSLEAKKRGKNTRSPSTVKRPFVMTRMEDAGEGVTSSTVYRQLTEQLMESTKDVKERLRRRRSPTRRSIEFTYPDNPTAVDASAPTSPSPIPFHRMRNTKRGGRRPSTGGSPPPELPTRPHHHQQQSHDSPQQQPQPKISLFTVMDSPKPTNIIEDSPESISTPKSRNSAFPPTSSVSLASTSDAAALTTTIGSAPPSYSEPSSSGWSTVSSSLPDSEEAASVKKTNFTAPDFLPTVLDSSTENDDGGGTLDSGGTFPSEYDGKENDSMWFDEEEEDEDDSYSTNSVPSSLYSDYSGSPSTITEHAGSAGLSKTTMSSSSASRRSADSTSKTPLSLSSSSPPSAESPPSPSKFKFPPPPPLVPNTSENATPSDTTEVPQSPPPPPPPPSPQTSGISNSGRTPSSNNKNEDHNEQQLSSLFSPPAIKTWPSDEKGWLSDGFNPQRLNANALTPNRTKLPSKSYRTMIMLPNQEIPQDNNTNEIVETMKSEAKERIFVLSDNDNNMDVETWEETLVNTDNTNSGNDEGISLDAYYAAGKLAMSSQQQQQQRGIGEISSVSSSSSKAFNKAVYLGIVSSSQNSDGNGIMVFPKLSSLKKEEEEKQPSSASEHYDSIYSNIEEECEYSTVDPLRCSKRINFAKGSLVDEGIDSGKGKEKQEPLSGTLVIEEMARINTSDSGGKKEQNEFLFTKEMQMLNISNGDDYNFEKKTRVILYSLIFIGGILLLGSMLMVGIYLGQLLFCDQSTGSGLRGNYTTVANGT